MSNYKYVIHFYATKDLSKINEADELINYSNQIADFYKVQCDKLGFSYYDDKNKIKTKVLRLNEKNLSKLRLLQPQTIDSIDFYYKPSDNVYIYPIFTSKLNISKVEHFHSFATVIFDPDVKDLNLADVIYLMDLLEAMHFKIHYGISFVMEDEKEPIFFLLGAKTPGMREYEEEMVLKLAHNYRSFKNKNKVWGVFKINIIRNELITQEIMEQLTSLLSEDNIKCYKGFTIISIPIEDQEYMSRDSKILSDVEHIFRKYDWLM